MARTFGQYCGLAKALELVGERWALLIIRDLLVGPRRFTDLRNGLPRIPTNVLSTRLKELEETGLIQRRLLPRPHSSFVYELTSYGRDIEPALHQLSRWGARSLGEPEADDIVTADSLTEPDPDITIETGPGLKALMAGELSATDAIARGVVSVTGDASLLELFARTFPVGPPPAKIQLRGRDS
ncbi:MAG TPA: helix-turn-helix domain-containing protein [Jiangellales bacterium]|nr:helix-turn-helix domain-containing protein [Jiangellales bacterium]